MENYPRHPPIHVIHEVQSPEIRRALKALSAEVSLEKERKVEMPPKKKRKVESNKPTQEKKQGKTKNYWS